MEEFFWENLFLIWKVSHDRFALAAALVYLTFVAYHEQIGLNAVDKNL